MMNIGMRLARGAIFAGALVGAVVTGCAVDATEGSSESATTQTEALFKDPSSSGPRLDVYEFNGHAALSVGGPIGTEDILGRLSGVESLEQLYRAIHPEVTEVPAELVALNERLAPALAELRSTPRADVVEPVRIDKSESSFTSAVCKGFREPPYKYTPSECRWNGATKSLSIFNWPLNIQPGDRTYGWNNNNFTARLAWWAYPASGATLAGSITLPIYWWNWMSLSSGGPYSAAITLNSNSNGELGLSHHKLGFTF